jgi:CAAX prenyl protease-like protein
MSEPGTRADPATRSTPTPVSEPPIWPYVLPLAGFLALTAVEGYLPRAPGGAPSPVWYPLAYAAKLVVVSTLLWVYRGVFRDLMPWPTAGTLALAVGVGLAVASAWVGLDGRYPNLPFVGGNREGFDPSVLPPLPRGAFLAVRMLGLVVLVPLVEELFYRSFLMRWLVDPVYTRVPIGKVTPVGLSVTTLVFAASHPEWLPALLTGLAWGWLLARTRSVSACVVSHSAANLALGVYVIARHAWKFW